MGLVENPLISPKVKVKRSNPIAVKNASRLRRIRGIFLFWGCGRQPHEDQHRDQPHRGHRHLSSNLKETASTQMPSGFPQNKGIRFFGAAWIPMGKQGHPIFVVGEVSWGTRPRKRKKCATGQLGPERPSKETLAGLWVDMESTFVIQQKKRA